MKNYSKEFKVGIIALLSGMILYFGVRFLKGIDLFSSTSTYYAVYDDIGGLKLSNSVMLNGFAVGRVSEIEFVPKLGNKMLVSLDIENNIEIAQGSIVALEDEGLLGGKMINLKFTDKNSIHEEGDTLKSEIVGGMVASLEETASPIIMKLEKTLTAVNLLLDSLNGMTGDMKGAMSNVESLTAGADNIVKRNSRDIELMLDSLKLLSGNLATASRGMPAMIDNFNSFSDSLKQMPLVETVEGAQATLAALKTTLDGINEGQGTMGKLMKDEAMYNNLNTALLSLDTLLTDFEEHPKRYIHFSVFGKKDK
ncbi:MlaD family protein [Flammeovirgaceae bacterium SG7u.111]|nr:MlaD family protein [Flammeovirgaceae bacterium SG7u.132]WPO38505.1 MlaD family protein [Flammeovirgaceae bacterium SG7u.111]